MNRIHIACATALVVASHAVAQLPAPPSSFPRVHSLADKTSPVGPARYHMKLAAPGQLLPAAGGMPTTANFVHSVYADTDSTTSLAQYEYRYSTSGGVSWSDPVVLHKFITGEKAYNVAYVDQLVCEGRNVFYVFWSNRYSVSTSRYFAVYAYGSNDMGKTWQGPLLMSPALVGSGRKWDGNTPELDASAGDGKVHVAYESHRISNVGGPVAGNEECLYSNAGFDSSGKFTLLRRDVNMSNLPNPTFVDVDAPRIDVDGKLVAVIWVDDRKGASSLGNQTFVRVSRDSGVTFDKEVDISQSGGLNISTGGDAAFVAVDTHGTGKGSIYCTYQDTRLNVGVTDALFLAYSKDGGATWTRKYGTPSKLIMLNAAIKDEVDHVQITADEGTVAISWFDEPTQGNLINHLKVRVDPYGGRGWVLNLIPPLLDLSKNFGVTDVQHLESMKMKGKFICIGYEVISTAGKEAAGMSWSCDNGLTWQTQVASDGLRDVDEPTCSVTLNGDFNLIYLEDFTGGNTTVVTGLKVPTLVNDKSATQGVKVTCANGSIGGLAIALFTATPADMKANKPITFNNTGFAVQITQDLVFSIGLNAAFTQPTVYILTVDAKGNVAFPGILNFSSLVGVPIYCAVATVKLNGTLLEFTDPVKLR